MGHVGAGHRRCGRRTHPPAVRLGADQDRRHLGLTRALTWLNRRATAHASGQPISRILDTVSPDTITTIMLGAAGVLLLVGVDGGIYVVVPAVVAAMAGGVAS